MFGKIIISVVLLPIVLGGLFIVSRYQKNTEQVVPFPYQFQSKYKLKNNTPVMIIGDRLGVRLSDFASGMEEILSENLEKTLAIQKAANKNFGIHRTLEQLKSMKKLPKIIIYMGTSEETYEQKFDLKNTAKIQGNFGFFENPWIQTAIMLMPTLSRVVYHPIQKTIIKNKPVADAIKYTNNQLMRRNELLFKVFTYEIEEMFRYIKEQGSMLIVVSAPININLAPQKNCDPSPDHEVKAKLIEIRNEIKQQDLKTAYRKSKELTLFAPSNSHVYFTHGEVAKSLGKRSEAIQYLNLAAAFDCALKRSSPVFNSILRRATNKYSFYYFDLNKMLVDNLDKNVVFMDKIYPQNYFMEKASKAIALKVKKILKL